ncbi:hypothetical protein [Bacteroides zoogleoformans]|uniref:hypothetical protein n=1 Tax=Bacteroides zoogleoformans TaxID=28119 RepID=UPI00248F3EE3|nr:hypothetical protein [Bacteroides zoogleoformans]
MQLSCKIPYSATSVTSHCAVSVFFLRARTVSAPHAIGAEWIWAGWGVHVDIVLPENLI